MLLLVLMNTKNIWSQGLSKTEIGTAINSITKLISEQYVYPGKAKAIAAHVLAENRKGYFNEVTSWKTFASAMTQCLQRFSNDGHLFVRNDEQKVRELLAAETAVPDSNAQASFKYDPFFYGPAAREKNFGFSEVKILAGNTGYIKLSEINISVKSLPVLYAAMSFVGNTKKLIVDLRNNGGGGSEIGPVLESFFLPGNTSLLEFKTRNGESKTDQTVLWLTEKKYDHPLFILVNKGTASAAEAIAYALQQKKRATIIGQPTAGAANMSSWYVINNHLFISISTAAPTLPGKEESWEQKGVQPDHVVQSGEEIEYVLRQSNEY
jgi:C-terminal processing protease CtpA/Prc